MCRPQVQALEFYHSIEGFKATTGFTANFFTENLRKSKVIYAQNSYFIEAHELNIIKTGVHQDKKLK